MQSSSWIAEFGLNSSPQKIYTEWSIDPCWTVMYKINLEQICFYSDASKNGRLGMGCILNDRWIVAEWPENLELYTLMSGILTWQEELSNNRLTVFCDNMAVVHMINKMTSGSKHCMKLIRVLVLNGLQFNRRLSAKFIDTKSNGIADSLSRLDFK